MSVNVPLLRRVLEYITDHPDEWDQTDWARKTPCGTACCLAGHTALMVGQPPFFEGDSTTTPVVEGLVTIWEVAAEALGLDEDEADLLFDSNNSLEALWSLASDFTAGEIQVPAEVVR